MLGGSSDWPARSGPYWLLGDFPTGMGVTSGSCGLPHLGGTRAPQSSYQLVMAFQEIRLTFRVLAKNRGFTAIAALSLALGIGANSAIFSLADALLLRPLPIRDPGAVVTVTTNTPDNPYSGVSYPNYRDLRGKSQSFDGVVAFQLSTWGVASSANEIAQMRMGLIVSDNFFQELGVEPTLDRKSTRLNSSHRCISYAV